MDRCLIACPSAGTATSHLVEHAVLTHFHLSVVELIDSSDKKPAVHCLSAGFTCLWKRILFMTSAIIFAGLINRR